MSKNTNTPAVVITDVKSANSLITNVKNSGKFALAYVEANHVTADNMGQHVKALTSKAYPGVTPTGRKGEKERAAKNFADKIRLALRTAIGDAPKDRKPGTENLLTGHGCEALAGKSDAEIVAMIMAELTNRAK